MLDGSEFSFEYEDEVSLLLGESEADSEFGPNSLDQGSKCLSPEISISQSLREFSFTGKQRTWKSPNFLSSLTYRPLSVAWFIYEHMVRPAQRLQRDFLPQFSVDEILVLLHYKRWLVDEVTSAYFDDWPRLRDACGLTNHRHKGHLVYDVKDFTCSICCEAGNLAVFALECGHEFCAACYKRYVQLTLPRGLLLRCMATQCTFLLLPSEITLLLAVEIEEDLAGNNEAPLKKELLASGEESDESDDQTSGPDLENTAYDAQFENINYASNHGSQIEREEPLLVHPLLISAARLAIDAQHLRYRWCPATDCTQLVESIGEGETKNMEKNNDLGFVAVVTCADAHEFCFGCHYENHLPCPCWLAQSWVKRCEDDSETVNWIDANTQGCPKCQAVIEKNGGCNHMVCGKCTHEFCWICLGDWAVHNSSWWQCNRFDPKQVEEVKKKRSDKQNSLGRYLHFYRRFAVHQVSMDGDKNTLKTVHRCMLQYMKAQAHSDERTGSWNDVQFLSDAIRSLSSGRKTLMWTYAFVFYLNKSNFAEIFEGMQDYLNKTVEDLSRLFENIKVLDAPEKTAARIVLKKTDIIALASLVTRRRELLIECAHTGLQLGALLFFTP